MQRRDPALLHVVAKAGDIRPLARLIGVRMQSVQRWKRIPPNRVIQIEQLTGLDREFLRPDLHPPRQRRRSSGG